MHLPHPTPLTTLCLITALVTACTAPTPPAAPAPATTSTATTSPASNPNPKPNPKPTPTLTIAPPQTLALDAHAEGLAAALTHECHRCHAVPGLNPPPPTHDCTGCHVRILSGDWDTTDAQLTAWQAAIRSQPAAPSLASLRRLRRDWLLTFLAAPTRHTIRPQLAARMIRHRLTDAERDALLDALQSPPLPAPATADAPSGDPARGLHLLRTRGCLSCHAPDTPPPATAPPAQLLAPDLRHTAARMTPATIRAWLLDPRALQPDALMPDPQLTPQEASDLTALLTLTPHLLPTPPSAPSPYPPAPPAPLPATFAHVKRRVLDTTCRHCHAPTPEAPGYAGGLGAPALRLDLTSEEGLRRGITTDDGTHIDLLRGPNPLLLQALRELIKNAPARIESVHRTVMRRFEMLKA